MTDQADLFVPLSALTFASFEQAVAVPENWDVVQTGVLLQHAVTHLALTAIDAGAVHPVSVTLDVSAAPANGDEIIFDSRIDRKTRTLIFASGIARQRDQVLLKATIVYRIA
ncbi:MAG: hypothetical protein AAFY82_00605 [Pseudomonadota bacterium]